jgi:hypothetical protein
MAISSDGKIAILHRARGVEFVQSRQKIVFKEVGAPCKREIRLGVQRNECNRRSLAYQSHLRGKWIGR